MAEDMEVDEKGEPKVGKLRRAMYGTRDAAKAWAKEVAKTMDQHGSNRVNTPLAISMTRSSAPWP